MNDAELIRKTCETLNMSLEAIKEDLNGRVRLLEKALDRGILSPMGRTEIRGEGVWSLSQAALGMANDHWNNGRGLKFTREKEWHDRCKGIMSGAQQRAQSEIDDEKGGFLVPNQIELQIVEARRAKSVLDKLPTTKVEGIKGSPFEVRKETSVATATYGAESAGITETDEKFGQTKGEPHELKALVKVPNGLIMRSSPAVDVIITNALVKAVALKRDITGLKGTGVSNEPAGISVSGVANFVMGTITYKKLVDMEGTLDDDDVEMEDRGWVGHPKIRRKLRQLLDGQNFPIFGRQYPLNGLTVLPVQNENMFLLNEILFGMTTQVSGVSASADLFLGYWPDLWMLTWAGLELMATKEGNGAFEKNETHIRIIETNDFLVTRIKSFLHSKDVVTA